MASLWQRKHFPRKKILQQITSLQTNEKVPERLEIAHSGTILITSNQLIPALRLPPEPKHLPLFRAHTDSIHIIRTFFLADDPLRRFHMYILRNDNAHLPEQHQPKQSKEPFSDSLSAKPMSPGVVGLIQIFLSHVSPFMPEDTVS